MKDSFVNRLWIGLTIGVFILHFIPYLIQGDNAYIRIHDTLEGEWIWLHTLVSNQQALDVDLTATIPQIMNGIPRAAYPTGLSIPVLLISCFGLYAGYLINYYLTHLVAFFGMLFFCVPIS